MITQEEKQRIYEMYCNGGGFRGCIKEFHHGIYVIKKVLAEFGIYDSKYTETQYRKRKPDGYWNDKGRCEEVAKQCVNRGEFSKRFVSAYTYSKNNGWLEDFDKYFDKEPHFADYSNPIHLVYAYEVKETNSVYVGRTTNLKRRDNAHRKDCDTINIHCKENGVEIPEPRILQEKLTAPQSQEKEGLWVNIYINLGWNILNKANTGIGSSSLGSRRRIWTYESCREAAEHCSSKVEYREKYPTANRVATQNHWINDFFENVKKDKGYYESYENCFNECKKYNSIKEIRAYKPFVYHTIVRHKWYETMWKELGWK